MVKDSSIGDTSVCTLLLRVINIKFYSRKVECDISVSLAIKLHSFLVELVYLLASFQNFLFGTRKQTTGAFKP